MTAQLANGGFKIYPKITVSDKEDTLENIKYRMSQNAMIKDQDISPLVRAGEELFKVNEKEYKPLYRNPENIKFVLDAMFSSTNELMGTSYSSRIDDPKYQFAGKTGTSQVKRITEEARELDLDTKQIPYEERDHALYIALGPYKNPRYAVSVIVEHGGSGSSTAAPIAKKLFKLIIDRHELREKIRVQNLTTI
jgi:penicillin-binding protein 2